MRPTVMLVVVALLLTGCSVGVSDRVKLIRPLAGMAGIVGVGDGADSSEGHVSVTASLARDASEQDLVAFVDRWVDAANNVDSTTSLQVQGAYVGSGASTLTLDGADVADPAGRAREWFALSSVAIVSTTVDADGASSSAQPLQPSAATPSAVADLVGSLAAVIGADSGAWTVTVGAVGLESADGLPDAAALDLLRSFDAAWALRHSSRDSTLDVTFDGGTAVALDLSPDDLADAAHPGDAIGEDDAWRVAVALARALPAGATLSVTAFGAPVATVGGGACVGALAHSLDAGC